MKGKEKCRKRGEKSLEKRIILLDFLGGPVANACDMGLISGQKDSTSQLSLCMAVTEPVHESPWATTAEVCVSQNLHSTAREASVMRSQITAAERSPCSLHLEKTHAQQQNPMQPKIK